jgi:tetratricopeptide (TPR) repeat protein
MLKRLLATLLGKASAASSKNSAQNAHDLFDAADYSAALIAYETLFIATKEPQHLVNSGYCELMSGQLDLARTSFRSAHALAPHLAQALIGLGDVAARQQSHAEAVACYDQALAIDAQLAIARNNRSQSLTALGRLEEAWRDAEARYLTPGATSLYPHRLDLPVWDGRSACRLLVHWEQGLGDIIQHLRFLPEAARRAGQCSFECPPPLLSVAQGLAGSLTLIAANSHAPDTGAFDCHAPLLSLPYLLQHTPKSLPPPPYLQPPPAPVPHVLDDTESAQKNGSRIGLVWRASVFDTRRNLSLACLLELASHAVPSVQFVSLQKDVTRDEAVLLRKYGCLDAGSGVADFGDTALVIRELDAVISVDTSVAHLAGALAHPTLLMLNHQPAERWMLTGHTSPWYPTALLVRRAHDEPESDWIGRALTCIPAVIASTDRTPARSNQPSIAPPMSPNWRQGRASPHDAPGSATHGRSQSA